MKVLLPDLVGQQELATRFLREIKLMASLNHPNIAQLRTAFTANNQLVMIMEYVEGSTLADRLEHGPIPVPEALNYTGAVLDALSYAHHQHVIHRDIKPANIMVTPEGAVKLMDFGIARTGDGHSLTMIARLHVAGAGSRRGYGRALRLVFRGRVTLRNGHGAATLPGR
jgi:serine/threonine-protein kinase